MCKPILVALLAGAAFGADAPKPASTEEAMVVGLAEAKFAPVTVPGVPPGVQGAMIGVDPTTKGATTYAKIPGGFHFPMHWHSYAEYTVLISGSGTLSIDGKSHELKPGSYFVIPARAKHDLDCNADCLLLTRRAGPTDYNFVK
jgi:quercetin dioxygenase-like cupin family protein